MLITWDFTSVYSQSETIDGFKALVIIISPSYRQIAVYTAFPRHSLTTVQHQLCAANGSVSFQHCLRDQSSGGWRDEIICLSEPDLIGVR